MGGGGWGDWQGGQGGWGRVRGAAGYMQKHPSSSAFRAEFSTGQSLRDSKWAVYLPFSHPSIDLRFCLGHNCLAALWQKGFLALNCPPGEMHCAASVGNDEAALCINLARTNLVC